MDLGQLVHREIVRLQVEVLQTVMAKGIFGDSHLATRMIRVQRDITYIEQQCTIMHELAHIELGHIVTEDMSEEGALEWEADKWAAERLIPEPTMRYAMVLAPDLRGMSEICGVDDRTMRARLVMSGREPVALGPAPAMEKRTLILNEAAETVEFKVAELRIA